MVIPKRLNLEFLFCVTAILYRAMRLKADARKTVSIIPFAVVMERHVNFQTADYWCIRAGEVIVQPA
jgi:hypothetical protein